MLPSIFRINSADPDALRAAEKDLVERIQQTIRVRRFDRQNLPAPPALWISDKLAGRGR